MYYVCIYGNMKLRSISVLSAHQIQDIDLCDIFFLSELESEHFCGCVCVCVCLCLHVSNFREPMNSSEKWRGHQVPILLNFLFTCFQHSDCSICIPTTHTKICPTVWCAVLTLQAVWEIGLRNKKEEFKACKYCMWSIHSATAPMSHPLNSRSSLAEWGLWLKKIQKKTVFHYSLKSSWSESYTDITSFNILSIGFSIICWGTANIRQRWISSSDVSRVDAALNEVRMVLKAEHWLFRTC